MNEWNFLPIAETRTRCTWYGFVTWTMSFSSSLSDADVGVLKQQLRDKDAKLTDIRLEALSSAHQLEQLRETMTKMKVSFLITMSLYLLLVFTRPDTILYFTRVIDKHECFFFLFFYIQPSPRQGTIPDLIIHVHIS